MNLMIPISIVNNLIVLKYIYIIEDEILARATFPRN